MTSMKRILFLVFLASTAACPDRTATMTCFYEKADASRDGRITTSELTSAIDSRLSWFMRGAFHVFGGIGRIMDDCDENKDGILTLDESLHMDTCMDSCFKINHASEMFNCV